MATIRDKLAKVLENKALMAQNLYEAGTVSDLGADLGELAQATKGVGYIGAERVKATVSASTQVMRGEYVCRVGEYTLLGNELRWGLEDVHILDTAELSRGRVGVVFTQGTATKFKVLAFVNGALALGNTLPLVEDEAVEEAKVIELATNRAMVIYNQDAAGMAAVISLDGRAATLAYTDIWDDRDVANLCACRLQENRALLAGMRLQGDGRGEVYVRLADATDTALKLRKPIRVDGNNDIDVYAGAWALCRASDTTGVLIFPQDMDKPVGFAVIDVDQDKTWGDPGNLIVRCLGQGKYAAALPTIAAAGLEDGRWAMAYGVGWLSADRQVVKSTLALEVWGLTRYAAELMWYGCEDTKYNASIGAVGLEPSGVGLACTYTGDEAGRSILLGMLEGPALGPAVPLGSHGGFCRVVPITVDIALLVTQREGNGYVRLMQAAERVIPCVDNADGIALSGGTSGQQITVAMSKT